jgi:hypothetical protein
MPTAADRQAAGYIPAPDGIHASIIDDPTPGPSFFPKTAASSASCLRASGASKPLLDAYDTKTSGEPFWFLNWNVIVLHVRDTSRREGRLGTHGAGNSRCAAQPLRSSVGRRLPILDRWRLEASSLRKAVAVSGREPWIYSIAYARWGDPEYLKDARQIRRYLKEFLTSPEGAFYTSQDADLVPGQHSEGYFALDDKARREKGIPRIDTHVYSRENGWAISALSSFYAVTGETEHLDDAVRAANWIIARRALPDGFDK